MMLEVGQRVEVIQMPDDSFYKNIRGTVTKVLKNGWVNIIATEVINKWSETNQYENHPSYCSTAAKIENIRILNDG